MPGPPAPTRLRPAGAGCAGAAPGSPRLRPKLPSWAVCFLSVHRQQCPLRCWASRAMACAPTCLPPACRDPCGALTHLQHLSSFLLSPPTPGSSASVARSLPGVPPSLLPSPHRSLPAAAPIRGIRLSMVAGDRCLPSPGCSPSTGRPPGAKPPPP
ncbi:unnamed protein product [Rangifer tarandus platyrhynchus]|uniref:Uncharacterized protein n=2 Tax=Rangifer tarandus platyrhynchus TaxID=3082113 RepID=A0AC59ZSX9_RANTA|nr:unnamed protein product [Rangifer tarandus platyrhynchus]